MNQAAITQLMQFEQAPPPKAAQAGKQEPGRFREMLKTAVGDISESPQAPQSPKSGQIKGEGQEVKPQSGKTQSDQQTVENQDAVALAIAAVLPLIQDDPRLAEEIPAVQGKQGQIPMAALSAAQVQGSALEHPEAVPPAPPAKPHLEPVLQIPQVTQVSGQSHDPSPSGKVIEELRVTVEAPAAETPQASGKPQASAEPIPAPPERSDRLSGMVEEAARRLAKLPERPETPMEAKPVQTAIPTGKPVEEQPQTLGEPPKAEPKAEPMLREVLSKDKPRQEEEAPAYHSIAGAMERLSAPKAESLPQEPKAEAPAPTRQLEEIRAAVLEQSNQGKTVLELDLSPHELGRISVRMTLQQGRLAVELTAASPKAEQLLRTHLEELTGMLRASASQELSSVQVVSGQSEAGSRFEGSFHMSYQDPDQQKQQHPAGQRNSGTGGGQIIRFADAAEAREADTPRRLLNYAV